MRPLHPSRRLAWGTLLALLASGASAAAPAAKKHLPATTRKAPAPPPAEEGVWKVTLTPEPDAAARGEKVFEDTLTLQRGKFSSSACVPHGFSTIAYKVEAGLWSANGESPREGKVHWHGEVSGEAMSGKMVWTKSDGTILHYSFSGSRAGAGAGQTQKSS